MQHYEIDILQYLSEQIEPRSNKEISDAIGLNRTITYRFLYKARTYGSGKAA